MLLPLVLIAACGTDDGESPALTEENVGGACFASCGTAISTCYSGPEMSASQCQSIASDMCPDNAVADFVSGCECSDDPMQGPDDC